MNNIVLGGIVVFFVLLMLGRRVSNRYMETMACKDKDRLIDSFSSFRKAHIIPLLFIMLWYFVGTRLLNGTTDLTLYSVYCLLCVYVLGINLYVYRELRRREFPPEYLRVFIISRSLTFAGLLVLVGALIFGGN